MNDTQEHLPLVGWREWLKLPDLGVEHIKAKVDTGARTSALHTFYLEPFKRNNQQWVKFGLHPLQGNTDLVIECEAPVKDQRIVSDSGGHKENRYVIETTAVMGDVAWPIEITLTDRDSMKFRMLLGRTALDHRFLVNPAASYQIGKPAPAINK
ncbi:MAG: ATP-dependent zinc protease [Gammaproteobacteria bacterium]|nr:ATP-dependent zinc protease [Gammaproteobacteria bacterium]